MRLLVVLALALGACRSNVTTFTVKEPSSVSVYFIAGHHLHPGHHATVELKTEDGVRVEPFDTESWSIEAIQVTQFYRLGAGTYHLFNHRNPTIKTLRQRPARTLVGDRGTEVLDANTDANDDHGRTREAWHIVPRSARPYFVLVTEPTHDASEDFRAGLFDAQGQPIDFNPGIHPGGPWHHVGGASWLGPVTGQTKLEVMMWGTKARRYTVRVVQPEEREYAPRIARVGTVVRGELGPGTAEWSKERGWRQTVRFTGEQVQTLYVMLWWTPDPASVLRPNIGLSDETDHLVTLRDILRDGGPGEYRYVSTRVHTTDHPVRDLEFHLYSSSDRPRSGRYVLCVATDPNTCKGKGPGEPIVW